MSLRRWIIYRPNQIRILKRHRLAFRHKCRTQIPCRSSGGSSPTAVCSSGNLQPPSPTRFRDLLLSLTSNSGIPPFSQSSLESSLYLHRSVFHGFELVPAPFFNPVSCFNLVLKCIFWKFSWCDLLQPNDYFQCHLFLGISRR